MKVNKEGRESRSPADVYDELFVPALFLQWGGVVAGEAHIGPGDRVLDVACGTGVLACAAAERVGESGSVVGIDPNEEMLTVARRKGASVDWRVGRAEALPFPDASFDAVVSQFGLMFFEDRSAGLREMMRVLVPGGRLAVAVCDALERSPGYWTLAGLLESLFGDEVASAFRAPFALGDQQLLLNLCAVAGIHNATVAQHSGRVEFSSVESLVSTERACVWTLGGLLDDDQFAQLLMEATTAFEPYRNADGAVAFDMPALIITATKAR